MTNHPNRSTYHRLIAKLQRISANGDLASDVRRIARDRYQSLMAAEQPPRRRMSDASYRNLYGEAAVTTQRDDEAAIEEERQTAMDRAEKRALDFLAAWPLATHSP